MEIKIKTKMRQALIPSLAMQQAFFVLQLSQLELAEWLHLQIELNPLLEYKELRGEALPVKEEQELDFDKKDFEILDYMDESFRSSLFPEDQEKEVSQEELLSHPVSLSEHLREQAREVFSGDRLQKAEEIICSLDPSGFLGESVVDEEVLKVIQSFDPLGVGARNLKESLLIQLVEKGEKYSLLYRVISFHFEDLLQNKFSALEKKLNMPPHTLKKRLKKDLFSLNFQPGAKFIKSSAPALIPDVFIYKLKDTWNIEINNSYLPPIKMLNLDTERLSTSEKTYVKDHLAKGKWLLRIVSRRYKTLKQITRYLLKHQQAFFNGETHHLVPLNMQDAARELGLHASTIARITSHKYLSAPQGIFLLRNFFSHALKTADGTTISHHTVKRLLLDLITKENKKKPLSDDTLVTILSTKGIQCARRTITKYRKILLIPSSQQRKE